MAKTVTQIKRTGQIHFARVEKSPRLARLLMILNSGMEYTTRQLIQLADICCVNTAVAELRAQGVMVNCRCIERGVYGYQLTEFAI